MLCCIAQEEQRAAAPDTAMPQVPAIHQCRMGQTLYKCTEGVLTLVRLGAQVQYVQADEECLPLTDGSLDGGCVMRSFG
jgi:hypothetical protein